MYTNILATIYPPPRSVTGAALSFVFYTMRDVHVRALDTPAAEHEAT